MNLMWSQILVWLGDAQIHLGDVAHDCLVVAEQPLGGGEPFGVGQVEEAADRFMHVSRIDFLSASTLTRKGIALPEQNGTRTGLLFHHSGMFGSCLRRPREGRSHIVHLASG